MNRRAFLFAAHCAVILGMADFAAAQIRPRRNGDGDGRDNNEIEGAIWEFKAVPAKLKEGEEADEKTIRGKLRIKGNAIFEIPEKRSRRPKSAEDEHRVGDVTKRKVGQSVELQLRFDDHPKLDGRAILKTENRKEGGVWKGNYTAKDGTKYRCEMRRGED